MSLPIRHSATDAAAPDPSRSSPLVLIVDDNQSVTKALTILLTHAGMDALPCNRGSEALACAQSPAAAVVDVHLPDINGLVLARQLRDRFGPAMPIIIVSGDTSMETINSLAHVGATYFFSKPVNATQLVDRLKELLAEKRADD